MAKLAGWKPHPESTYMKNKEKEDEEVKPVLSYALSKSLNEKQLKQSGKKYTILRLGSVYGYIENEKRIRGYVKAVRTL